MPVGLRVNLLEQIADELPLPGLHIADVVCCEILAHGWKRVGLLGFSAGGNLAGHAAWDRGERTYPQKPDLDDPHGPDFLVFIYGGGFFDKENKTIAVKWEDELVRATCLTRDGAIVHSAFQPTA